MPALKISVETEKRIALTRDDLMRALREAGVHVPDCAQVRVRQTDMRTGLVLTTVDPVFRLELYWDDARARKACCVGCGRTKLELLHDGHGEGCSFDRERRAG